MKKRKIKRKYIYSHKKRNIFIFLVFVLFLGMGYSLLSTDIGIFGSINVSRYKEPIIMTTNYSDRTTFRSDTYRTKIKTITLSDKSNPPANIIESWDIGVSQNGNVMAYITQNANDNTMYDLYIQGKGHLYANEDSRYLFGDLRGVDQINGLDNLDISRVKNMSEMFFYTGYNSQVFSLDLGNNFDTSNVIDMSDMFKCTGYSNAMFTLNLGNKFDTRNVTNMRGMFEYTGFSSTIFTLSLGNKFDTSEVMDMSRMFYYTGVSNSSFTLGLGDKFDTSKVEFMYEMFYYTGYNSTAFTLDLGDKFDTGNVFNMSSLFEGTGYNSLIFTLDLGDKFNTSNVTNMYCMFAGTGFSSTIFTLDLGNKFDTSNVTDMTGMFSGTGYSSTIFTLDLGNKFDTGNVTEMIEMFSFTGSSSSVFTLDLGDKFDTSKVTNMYQMFCSAGSSSPVFTLDLGDKFDTSKVTNMNKMFCSTGSSSPEFVLDLGNKFDTSRVTNMSDMFSGISYLKTIYVTSSFVTTSVNSSDNMFTFDYELEGSMGTTYDDNHTDATYAHIDGGISNPGYFSDRTEYAQQLAKKSRVKKVENIGKKVSFVSKYSNDLIWRLFYADDDYVYLISSKLYDNNGDVYEIEAQRTNYGGLGGVGLISQQDTSYSGSEDITDPFLRSLNSMWYEFLADDQNAQFRTCESAKATAWFMDQNRWANWKDNDGYAKYAIGGPPLELFVKSYNATAASNSQTSITLSIVNGGYDTSSTTNRLQNSYNNGIYHLRGPEDAFWLSSPGGNNEVDLGLRVRTSGGNGVRPYGIYFGQTGYNLGLRPVVIIPINDYVASPYGIIYE